jgi:hypothetical protein
MTSSIQLDYVGSQFNYVEIQLLCERLAKTSFAGPY